LITLKFLAMPCRKTLFAALQFLEEARALRHRRSREHEPDDGHEDDCDDAVPLHGSSPFLPLSHLNGDKSATRRAIRDG
jgi:hypothetical protein